MASPIVCVLKGKDGVWIVNYQYLNRYTVGDKMPLPEISEIIQKFGAAHYISLETGKKKSNH